MEGQSVGYLLALLNWFLQKGIITTGKKVYMKSKGTAYLLWCLSIFGWLGLHRFYLRKIGTGIIWVITGGVLGFGSLVDLFTLGEQVESYNAKHQIKQIRNNIATQPIQPQ